MRDTTTSDCDGTRAALALRYYDPPAAGSADPVGAHLDACAACAASWRDLRALLDQVRAEDAYPREAEVDWERFARATVARARAAAASPGVATGAAGRAARAWFRIAATGLAAATAIVVFFALRSPTPAPVPTARVDADADTDTPGAATALRRNVARQAAARSLRDGRALLVELMQAPVRCRRQDGTFDIALEKERSRDLLRRLAMHQGSLTGTEDRRIVDLMAQMENLLLQVSTLEDCAGSGALEDLREAIGARQFLLRIDLVTREVEGGTTRA
ncbi:MAG TPA: hypothetical protein VMQ62_09215 [Dongiaceae bacterium]|nr:hypothetical protein [Dongiaceae bacterium]